MATEVTFREPALLRPVMFQFKCSACESEIWTKVTKPQRYTQVGPRKDMNAVSISARLLKASPMLIEMMKEEAEFNKPRTISGTNET